MIQIPLHLPDGPNKQAFLRYFSAELRRRMSDSSGQAGRRDDGTFESQVNGTVALEIGRIPLRSRYVESAQRELLFVEVDQYGSDASCLDWERSVEALVRESLVAALASKTQSFFRRIYRNYVGPKLDGEYWFGKLRVAPAWPEDDEPILVNAERVVVFDQMIVALDGSRASVIANEAAARLSARFSLLLNVALYPQRHEMLWVYPDPSSNASRSSRCQLGFVGFGAVPSELPSKGELCKLGGWDGNLLSPYREARPISFPPQSRAILKSIDRATPAVTAGFDSCARLFQVGLDVGRHYPSAELAYKVAAIEALSATEGSGFSDFMRRYCRMPEAELKPYLDFLYGSVRSSHFHAGGFPLGEYDAVDFPDAFLSSEYADRSRRQRASMSLTHEAIANWLLSRSTPNSQVVGD